MMTRDQIPKHTKKSFIFYIFYSQKINVNLQIGHRVIFYLQSLRSYLHEPYLQNEYCFNITRKNDKIKIKSRQIQRNYSGAISRFI